MTMEVTVSTTAAIMISRQPIRPCGRTLWVRSLKAAIKHIGERGLMLITSVGLLTWDLQVALAAALRIPMVIVLPLTDPVAVDQEMLRIMREFDLQSGSVRFRPLKISGCDFTKHDFMQTRDREIITSADLLLPVAVRDGGTMDRLLTEGRNFGKTIIDHYCASSPAEHVKHAYRISPSELNPNLDETGEAYLIHFTRASNEAWPTESYGKYCRAVLDSDRYPRGALETLQNIVAAQHIVASTRHMPRRIATVSFTALSPRELAPLIRWRARYGQMSFEPYGIGVERQCALERGVVPVTYTEANEDRPTAEDRIWRYQSVGRKTDWRQEREYRCRGDFDLSGIPAHRLRLFCRYPAEATRLEEATGIRTHPFTNI